jgi:ectoine hydroxylase-related dioxygenase (phytanoyl-CoA dioxygenase family)
MSSPADRPLPTAEFEVEPTAEEVERFAEDGFLVVERITTDEEIDWLAELYEWIFDPSNTDSPEAFARDQKSGEAQTESLLRQVFMPEFRFPQLLQTVYNRNARKYAAALLQADVDDVSCWGHMIRKAPGGREAPWHQDEAYWETELEYHALGAWLPLHEVTEEMGCMQFVRGSHRRGVYDHQPLNGDVEMHLLVADFDVESAEVVACPLPKGGVTFHSQRTLHFTATNRTDRPRLAFPTEFQLAPRRRAEPALRPWVDDWRTVTGPPDHLDEFPADGAIVPIAS